MKLLMLLPFLTGCCLLDTVDKPVVDMRDVEIFKQIDILCMNEQISGESTYKYCMEAWLK